MFSIKLLALKVTRQGFFDNCYKTISFPKKSKMKKTMFFVKLSLVTFKLAWKQKQNDHPRFHKFINFFKI